MRPAAYKNYLLVFLMLVLAFNYVDRVAVGVVLQDIKIDLDLSDTQLGLLTGIAFAAFYSVMGIPIARWADRGNRVTIIALTTALWSTAVAMCAAAASFVQLLLIRIGVAVGEAGCIPPAHSLIADFFSRAERPRAAAIYNLGAPLSYLLGYFVAGWLNEFYGWRTTFLIIALPGLVLAVLARLTLREPRCSQVTPKRPEIAQRDPATQPSQPSLGEVCVTLWANVTFRHLLLSVSVLYFFGQGISLWQPTFFIRSYGLKSGEIGTWFALIYGLAGGAGMYLGGVLATRYAANNERLQLTAMAITKIVNGLLFMAAYLSDNMYLSFGLLAVAAVGGFSSYGPLFGTIQSLVPEHMRAMSIALVYLFANLIGMGLGPLATGALSDALREWAGEESLRYSLLILTPGFFWAAWHAWRASQTVARDVHTVQSQGGSRAAAPTKIALAD